jgi:hypothetical protein
VNIGGFMKKAIVIECMSRILDEIPHIETNTKEIMILVTTTLIEEYLKLDKGVQKIKQQRRFQQLISSCFKSKLQ